MEENMKKIKFILFMLLLCIYITACSNSNSKTEINKNNIKILEKKNKILYY